MKTVFSFFLLAALTGAQIVLYRRKYIHVAQLLNWTDAKAYCRDNYVDLMIIDGEVEYYKFMQDSAAYTDRCWIGLSKIKGEMVYTRWCDGSPLIFSKWRTGEPANFDTEDCTTTTSGYWSDRGCEYVLNVFCYRWEPELVVVQEMKTWDEALEHCRTFYTDLVSLNTQNDLHLANKLLANTQITDIQTTPFWTGLHFLDGSWFWINENVPVNLTSLPSCPASDYRCGAKTGADRLENWDCSEKIFFICSH